MPLYHFSCEDNHITEVYRHLNERDNTPRCGKCRKPTERSIVTERKRPNIFQPYVDHNLTSDPEGVKIESKRQKQKLMEQEGVRMKE